MKMHKGKETGQKRKQPIHRLQIECIDCVLSSCHRFGGDDLVCAQKTFCSRLISAESVSLW